MPKSEDAAAAIRQKAAEFPDVVSGTSCNQTSFKIGKGAFLFIGPGAKGEGFKAMFKLRASMPQALVLAEKQPDRFEVGSTDWVTTRFSNDKPLPKSIWQKWLKESHNICVGSAAGSKKQAGAKTTKKKPTKKKAAKKKA